MVNEHDEWNSLKAGWRADSPADAALGTRLHASLRWRIWASRTWFASELVSFAFLALAIVQKFAVGETFAAGWLTAIAGVCVVGYAWARRARRIGSAGSIPGMIDLSLARARQGLRIVYGSYVVIAMLLVPIFKEAEWPLDGDDRFLARMVWMGISTAAAIAYHLVTLSRLQRFESLHRMYLGRSS
ncbi:MAG: hypothetical protein H7Y89_18615 [Steroidobacteraceae bacterium]|nr:hypothetical protein [Steroidobacteraceae bacterium]